MGWSFAIWAWAVVLTLSVSTLWIWAEAVALWTLLAWVVAGCIGLLLATAFMPPVMVVSTQPAGAGLAAHVSGVLWLLAALAMIGIGIWLGRRYPARGGSSQ